MQVQKGEKIESLHIEGSPQIKYDYVHLNVSYDIFDLERHRQKTTNIKDQE